MHAYRATHLRLDEHEFFDADVPTEGSNAGSVKPFRRMRVQQVDLRDNLDGEAPRLHAEGRWYKAAGGLSAGGRAGAPLPWDQLPASIAFTVSRVLRTYRLSGGES